MRTARRTSACERQDRSIEVKARGVLWTDLLLEAVLRCGELCYIEPEANVKVLLESSRACICNAGRLNALRFSPARHTGFKIAELMRASGMTETVLSLYARDLVDSLLNSKRSCFGIFQQGSLACREHLVSETDSNEATFKVVGARSDLCLCAYI